MRNHFLITSNGRDEFHIRAAIAQIMPRGSCGDPVRPSCPFDRSPRHPAVPSPAPERQRAAEPLRPSHAIPAPDGAASPQPRDGRVLQAHQFQGAEVQAFNALGGALSGIEQFCRFTRIHRIQPSSTTNDRDDNRPMHPVDRRSKETW